MYRKDKNVLVPLASQLRFHLPPSFFIDIANRHPSTSLHKRLHDPQSDPSYAACHQRDSVLEHAQVKRFLEIGYLRTDQPGVDGDVSFSGIAVSHGRTDISERSSDIALSQAIAFDKPER
jgi:hypothetical protein